MKHLHKDESFSVKKDVADQFLENVRESERYLAWITYMHLIACFVSFVGLYYPNFKIPGTNVGSHDINLFFPFTMNVLLSSAFALHGYYMWRFYENRLFLHEWVHEHFQDHRLNVDLTGFIDSYRGSGAYETIFHNSSSKRYIPITILSIIFSINHSLIILNCWNMLQSDLLATIVSFILSALLVVICYVNYHKLLGNIVSGRKMGYWAILRLRPKLKRENQKITPVQNEQMMIRSITITTFFGTLIFSSILICPKYGPKVLSARKFSYAVKSSFVKSHVGTVRLVTTFVPEVLEKN
ncbi:MAG TPA: hypothetical protein VK151_17115 [Fluviicola sp.]|nr:hypothetical protein [Fluviicola sp.]